jgi:hypothetical protein
LIDLAALFEHNCGLLIRTLYMRTDLGLLAQLVEQRTFNPFVVGSIPAQPTNKKKGLRENVALFFVQNFNADLMCGFVG